MDTDSRSSFLFQESRKKAEAKPQDHFEYDLYRFATEKYASLPIWEKQARSMADAIRNQDVLIEPYDRVIGRCYFGNPVPARAIDPDLLYNRSLSSPKHNLVPAEIFPEYQTLRRYQLVSEYIPGHVAWNWQTILANGTEGLRRRCEVGLQRRKNDAKSCEFYRGVLIMIDALEDWNDAHVAELERMGMTEQAEICRRVPRYPARSFREAVQAYYMQHLAVMKENPHGGNSPGRLDYYLWPYLESDLKKGVCTLDDARELIEELFIRMDERLYFWDTYAETIVVGGSHPNGTSAVNPLSYIMIEAVMKYDLTHPLVYARLPKHPPQEFVDLCAHFMKHGRNRAQIMSDESIVKALIRNGVTEADATNYYCGGCMEIGVQGKTGDFLFTGFHNVSKLLELCMTGGRCLLSGEQVPMFSERTLADYTSFEEFYEAFIGQARKMFTLSLQTQDIFSEHCERRRPAFLLSSMLEGCLEKGRNMHAGVIPYYDYGSTFLGLANTADSLYAIKRAVFDDGFCTAEELLCAMQADFEGYEELCRLLCKLPKYGQEHDEVDALTKRLFADLSEIQASYVNRNGGNGKMVILTFTFSPIVGKIVGATPDGRKAGKPLAHGITPQSVAMTKGITAAINSCTAIDQSVFTGGATTMWDMDESWASEEIIRSLMLSFFEQGGQIFQGNVSSVEELLKAQENPEAYNHLIVRVGGFSARFVRLKPELQNEIIHRMRHKR